MAFRTGALRWAGRCADARRLEGSGKRYPPAFLPARIQRLSRRKRERLKPLLSFANLRTGGSGTKEDRQPARGALGKASTLVSDRSRILPHVNRSRARSRCSTSAGLTSSGSCEMSPMAARRCTSRRSCTSGLSSTAAMGRRHAPSAVSGAASAGRYSSACGLGLEQASLRVQ